MYYLFSRMDYYVILYGNKRGILSLQMKKTLEVTEVQKSTENALDGTCKQLGSLQKNGSKSFSYT